MDESVYVLKRNQTQANNQTMISDTSTIIENTLAVTKIDKEGNKYINQYKIIGKLGR